MDMKPIYPIASFLFRSRKHGDNHVATVALKPFVPAKVAK